MVETRRGLYNAAFGQSYVAQAALGRPLQRTSELFRKYVQLHELLTIPEYIAYKCLAFLEKQALPAEKGNAGRTEALNRVVRGVLAALEAEEDPTTLIENMCTALDTEDRLLASREVAGVTTRRRPQDAGERERLLAGFWPVKTPHPLRSRSVARA